MQNSKLIKDIGIVFVLLATLLATMLAVYACQPAAATQTASAADSLQSNPWQWIAFTNPVEKYSIENPQDYRLTFNPDGTVNIQADCNTAIGSYTAADSSLKIELGPMTLAACPPGSRSDDFVRHLGFSAIYFFQDGHLFIDLFADGGTLEFAPAAQ